MKNLKVKKYILLNLCVCFALFSCSKDNDNYELSEGPIVNNIVLSVKDTNGNDLLSPNNSIHFSEENISLEHLTYEGKETSKNYKIIKHRYNELYILNLESNLKVFNSKSKTIVHWNGILSDTIEVEFSKNLSKVLKISANNIPIWHHLQASSLPPTIVK
ncbi:hypothetical protein AAGV33_09095 [Flavobacterium sp. FBOR7N2.3]|uniref:Lipoprotein n=1 Tax=Flavobacterium magnesitis TaxID=3138077 RepID=A0ABV4TKP9_9FLAO